MIAALVTAPQPVPVPTQSFHTLFSPIYHRSGATESHVHGCQHPLLPNSHSADSGGSGNAGLLLPWTTRGELPAISLSISSTLIGVSSLSITVC